MGHNLAPLKVQLADLTRRVAALEAAVAQRSGNDAEVTEGLSDLVAALQAESRAPASPPGDGGL